MAILDHLHPMQFERLTTPVEYAPVSEGSSPLRTQMPTGRTRLDPGRTTTYMTPAGVSRRADVEHETRRR